jgi:ERCC4-type nuclease
MEIIVDDRERAVHSYLNDASIEYGIPYKIGRINVGDYAICHMGNILATIERKTLVDLASSFRDGRKENINKLLALREKTKCMIVYIIEEKNFYSPDHKVGRIPFKYLQAHLDHLMYRDNVFIIRTKNQESTAKRIFEFATNLGTLDKKLLQKSDKPDITISAVPEDHKENINGSHEVIADVVDTVDINDTNASTNAVVVADTIDTIDTIDAINNDTDDIIIPDGEPITDIEEHKDSSQTEQSQTDYLYAQTRETKTELYVQKFILRCLDGVGSLTVEALCENKITLKSLYDSKMSAESLSKIKFSSGRELGKKIATKITKCIASIDTNKKLQNQILTSIPNVGKAAENITQLISFNKLMSNNLDINSLASVRRSDKRCVGQALAKNILKYLQYVIV